MSLRERTRSNDGPLLDWFKTNSIAQDSCGEPPAVVTNTGGTFQGVTEQEVMHDIVTPGYERISGQGGIINSPMDYTKTVFRDNPCAASYVYSWERLCSDSGEHTPPAPEWHTYRHSWNGIFPSTDWCSWNNLPDVPTFDEQTLIDQAVTKAWAKIDTSEVQSLVMIGESEKTIRSLVSIFTRFVKVVKAAKRGEVRYLKRQISKEELSERYMELRYALRPLMYDVKGVTAALQTEASSKPLRATFRGIETYSDSDEDTVVTPVNYHNWVGDWDYEIVKDTVAEVDFQVRAGVLTEIANLNKLHVWGMLQPVEAVWELVPFSFIIDWFFNVGKTFASWTPNFGTKALASWYTVEKREYQFLGYSHINCATEDDNAGTYRALAYSRNLSECWIDKTVYSKTRVPDPSRKILPSFSLNVDVFKLTDLLIIAKKIWLKTA